MTRLLGVLAAAIFMLATMSEPAHADPISLVILGFLGLEATSFAVAATTFLLEALALVGLTYLAKALAPKPPEIPPGGTTGRLQTGGAIPRSFIVGRSMTAGSLSYANTYGADAAITAAASVGLSTAASGNTPNAYLVQVIALQDLPATGLVGVLVGGVPVTYNPALAPVFEGIPIPEYNSSNAVQDVTGSVPGTGPYTFSIAGAANIASFTSVKSVRDTSTDVDMQQVSAGVEGPDEYSFNSSTKVFTFNAANAGHTLLVKFNYGGASGTDYLWVRFYDGTQVVADPSLVALFSGDTNRPYDSNRIGTGVAYAIVTSRFNQDLFGGFPQIKFILDGIKLYDRRFDSSAGGSGAQRWSDPTTWAWTRNNTVIIENILRGISYAGKCVYGAQTVSAAQLPSPSWMAAASECDSSITLAGGSSEPQYTANGEIAFSIQPADTIDELLKACNGKLAEIGGVYKIRAGAPGSAVFSFTDDDILSTEVQSFDQFPSLGQTINAVTAKYVEPAEAWNQKDAPPLYDSTLEAADGGRRQVVDINYPFVTSGTGVQRLMKSARDDHRAFRTHQLGGPPDFFVLEPLDVISWTSTRNGYTSKLFDITAADDLPNLNMGLALKEIDPNAYDWTPGSDEQPISLGNLNPLIIPPQAIIDWSAEPWTVVSDSGATLPAIKLHWGPNVDDVDGVFFQVRLKSSGEVLVDSAADNLSAAAVIISHNLLFNTQYEARGRYRPISARNTSWSGWLTVTTPDARIILAALESSLNDYIGKLEARMNEIATLAQGVANWVGEQLGKNEIDKQALSVLSSSQVGNALSVVQTLAQTVASDEIAFADYQVTANVQFGALNTSIGLVSAGGIFQIIASAGTDGAAAVAKMQVSASVGATMADAGIELAAMVDAHGVAFSRSRLYAQSIQVGFPGVTGGAFVTPWAVQTVNGALAIAIQPDLVPDNCVTNRMMLAGALETITTVDSGNVTKTANTWNNGGAGQPLFNTINLTCLAGSVLLIDVTWDDFALPDGATGSSLTVEIIINGTILRTVRLASLFNVTMSARTVIAAAGAVSVDVRVIDSSTSGNRLTLTVPKLTCREVKKPSVVQLSGATPTVSVSYRTSLIGDTSGSFPATDIGTADPFRNVVVAIGWQGPGVTISGMTIGGVAATRHLNVSDQFGQGYNMAMFSLRVTAGTTADIVASFSSSPHAIEINVWKVVAFAEAPVWANVGYTTLGDTSHGPVGPITTLSGQVLTVASFGAPSSGGFDPSWGGTDTPTESADALTATTPNVRYGAWNMALTQARTGNFGVGEHTGAEAFVTVGALWQ